MAQSGRLFLVKKGGTAIAGAQTSSMSLDNSPVDITDKASGGWRELADFSGARSIDLAINGVWDDKVLRELALASDDSGLLLDDVTLEFGDGTNVLSGDFHLANYEETGEHSEAVTFTATLQSSGAIALATV